MRIRCPNCKQISEIEHVERGRHAECTCKQTFILDDSTVVEDYSSIDAAPPAQIGPYRVERFIGRGGMGKVYKAIHPTLHIPVAVKMLLQEFADNVQFKERFIKSAKICARVNHPNIVRVYDFGSDPLGLYLVLEYIGGGTALDILNREGHLSPEKVAEIALAVCNGLIEAEKQGIVHRDIKPENIMRTADGIYKLSDLGLAKQDPKVKNPAQGSTSSQTLKFVPLGTPQYMAPEQAIDARNCDIRADIYSLGITLYQLVTGQLPFDHPDLQTLRNMHLEKMPVVPSEIVPSVPLEMEYIIMRCIEKKKLDRYQTPAELKADLSAFLNQEELPSFQAEEPELPPEVSKPRHSGFLRFAAFLCLLLILAGLSIPAKHFFVDKSTPVRDNVEFGTLESGSSGSGAPAPAPTVSDASGNVTLLSESKLPPIVITSSSRPPDEKASGNEMQEAQWKFARNLAQTAFVSMDCFDSAIRTLEPFLSNPDYQESAAELIGELRPLRIVAVSRLLEELDRQVQPLLASHRYFEAALVYELYSGVLVSETADDRKILAQKYRAAAMKEFETAATLQLLSEISHLVCRGATAQALELYRKKGSGSETLRPLEPFLSELDRIPELFARQYESRVGELCSFDLKNDPLMKGTIKSVKPPVITIESKEEKGSISRRITLDSLTMQGQSRELDFLPRALKSVYMGIQSIRNNDYLKADTIEFKQAEKILRDQKKTEILLDFVQSLRTEALRMKQEADEVKFKEELLEVWNQYVFRRRKLPAPEKIASQEVEDPQTASEFQTALRKIRKRYESKLPAGHAVFSAMCKLLDRLDQQLAPEQTAP